MLIFSGTGSTNNAFTLPGVLTSQLNEMVDGLHLYSTSIQSTLQRATHLPIHKHTHTTVPPWLCRTAE